MKKEIMDKREQAIMEQLWTKGKALGVSELEAIFDSESEKKLGKASIFKALQSLLKKEYVKVSGLERAGMVYARMYEPNITKEEYAAVLLSKSGIRSTSLGSLVLAMIGNDRDENPDKVKDAELIEELEKIIENIKNGAGQV